MAVAAIDEFSQVSRPWHKNPRVIGGLFAGVLVFGTAVTGALSWYHDKHPCGFGVEPTHITPATDSRPRFVYCP